MIDGVRFEEPLESEFRRDFNRLGRTSRHEMWAVLLVAVIAGIIFHRTLWGVPPDVPLGPSLLISVAVPMVLRWLSGDHSPVRRWSSTLYIASVYIDVAWLMALRIACIRHGLDVVPLVMPVTFLMTLIVVQIRFQLLVPAITAGMAGIVVTELVAFDPAGDRLFGVATLSAMVAVALSAAYELERSARTGWLRARALAELTRTDPLTGVPNRRYFDDKLVESARHADLGGGGLAVMTLDIDHFKAFNDRNGHPAGDDCLRRVGAYLGRSASGPDEFCARLGGEEFAVVWCAADPAEAAARAEAIRSGIGGLAIVRDSDGGVVTASAGLVYDMSGGVGVELLRAADAALYRAKRSGRNQLVISDQRINASKPITAATPVAVPRSTQLAPPEEAEFRQAFDRQGRIARAAIMLGLIAVCIAILSTLRMPPESQTLAVRTVAYGIIPFATAAAATALMPRLNRFSAPMFITAVCVITGVLMAERIMQLSRGYDVVPYLMPMAVLLSMCVVKIRFRVLAPTVLAILLVISATELWVLPWTSNRFLTVAASGFMAAVAVWSSYKVERSVRSEWVEERELDELSHTDPLTGLSNRRSFDAALDCIDAATDSRYAAVMILDVDNFKGFNDRYGHPAGDDALRAIGGYLRVRKADSNVVVARIGGEEFAVLWRTPDHDGTRKRDAEALRHGIAALGPIAGTETTLTASAGFAEGSLSALQASARRLVERADQALYDAKGHGRNQLIASAPDAADGSTVCVRYE